MEPAPAMRDEVARFLVADNHRTRRGAPWSTRHTENMERIWRLHVAPLAPAGMSVAQFDHGFCIRVLNTAHRNLASPWSRQDVGKWLSAFSTWLVHRGLSAHRPLEGVKWTITAAQTGGEEPQAIDPATIPTMEMAHDLALSMALRAWRHRPGRGGNRRPDVVGSEGRAIAVALTATSGLRLGELLCVRPSWLSLSGCEIRVRRTWVEPDRGAGYEDVPKSGRVRTSVFAGWLREDLADHVARLRHTTGERDPLLWPAPMGGRDRRRNHHRRFRRAADAAGWSREHRWHGLRALFAVTALLTTDQAGLGLSLEETSRLLGHHSPEFTAKRYLRVREGWRERASRAAADLEL